MSWLYEKSSSWRRIVHVTRESAGMMGAFTAVCFVGAAAVGFMTMGVTDGRQQALEEKLKARGGGLTSQTMARVNKERLQVLLDDVKGGGKDSARYATSLDGRTLGTTHKTSVGSTGIPVNK
mmetsp:Transcript_25993/g.82916  ORF Transcript_25993/g.82916 Transcript_25993/m.82916 type:complete len:122 (-) Transcript_25993:141-506(-)